MRVVSAAAILGLAAFALLPADAWAQTAPPPPVAGSDAAAQAPADDFWTRNNLLGDMGGLRTTLDEHGVTLNLQETSEVFGNVTGGLRRGAAYDGLTQMGLVVDTGKAIGWEGGTFNASALQIHGRNFSAEKLLNLQTVSGFAGSRATRLWELWYQQAFLDGAADVKLGQQSLDQEFIVSQYSGLFVNTMMGWPMVPSADLYAGGPAYPLSSLGVRLRGHPSDPVTVLAGVFDDNPPGGPFNNDSQLRGAEKSGTKFNLGTGALVIAEIQYAVNQPPPSGQDTAEPPQGLAATYKLGAWYDSGAFPDQRFDDTGRSLADPASDGQPQLRRHNFSVYGVVDQMIWRPDPKGQRSIGVFARVMGAPADRNLISFSANAGVDLKAPFEGRDDDTVGLGYGVAKVSGRASDLDRDTVFFTQTARPIRSSEHFVELTYQLILTPWWMFQPDFQYVFNPGGGIPNPENASARIGNEAIFGLRTNITF